MLTTIIFDDQIILPWKVASEFRDTEYFRVTIDKGCIVLTPTDYSTREILDVAGEAASQEIGKRMVGLGITEADVAEAVARARGKIIGAAPLSPGH